MYVIHIYIYIIYNIYILRFTYYILIHLIHINVYANFKLVLTMCCPQGNLLKYKQYLYLTANLTSEMDNVFLLLFSLYPMK